MKAGYAKVKINGVWEKWAEMERGEYSEKGYVEEDKRGRNSKEDRDKIDNSRKETGRKEIEIMIREKEQEMSMDNINKENKNV